MIDSNAFLGLPLKFKSICKVYPPKIQDILTEENYSVYRKLFLTTQEDIEDEFAENKLSMTDIPDPMDYLFQMAGDIRIKKIIIGVIKKESELEKYLDDFFKNNGLFDLNKIIK